MLAARSDSGMIAHTALLSCCLPWNFSSDYQGFIRGAFKGCQAVSCASKGVLAASVDDNNRWLWSLEYKYVSVRPDRFRRPLNRLLNDKELWRLATRFTPQLRSTTECCRPGVGAIDGLPVLLLPEQRTSSKERTGITIVQPATVQLCCATRCIRRCSVCLVLHGPACSCFGSAAPSTHSAIALGLDVCRKWIRTYAMVCLQAWTVCHDVSKVRCAIQLEPQSRRLITEAQHMDSSSL